MATSNEKIQLLINAKDNTRGVLSKIKGQLLGIVAAYAGMRVGQEAFKAIIGSAVDFEKTMTSLRAVVSSTGRDMNEVMREMATHTGALASKAQIAEGFLKGMTTTLTVQQMSKMTQAVKEASLAMGEDFGRQLPLIVKAIKQLNPAILDNIGVTIRLDRLNKRIRSGYFGLSKEISETTQQHAIFIEIMKQTEQFRGQEEERLKTTSGQWEKLTAALSDLGVSIGTVLLPALTTLLEPLAAVAGSFTKATKATMADVAAQNIATDKIDDVIKRYRDGLIPTLAQFNKEIALAKLAKKEDSRELTNYERAVEKYRIELNNLVASQSHLLALPRVFSEDIMPLADKQSSAYKFYQKRIDDLIDSHDKWVKESAEQSVIDASLEQSIERAKLLRGEIEAVKKAMEEAAAKLRIKNLVEPAQEQAQERFLRRLTQLDKKLPEIGNKTGFLSKQLLHMGKVGENSMDGIVMGAKEALQGFQTFGMEVELILQESLVNSTISATTTMINQFKLLETTSSGFFKQMGVNFVNEFIRRAMTALITSGLLRIFSAIFSGGASEIANIGGVGFTGGFGAPPAPTGGDSLLFAINNRQTNVLQSDRNVTGRSLVQFR